MIRDLLAIENLPQEMDYSVLLPADNSSSGFDNIADLLYISPAVMERYLDSARKISRLAVGDPKAPVMVNIHTVGVQHPQDAQVEELPMGTRGGVAIRSYFPLDATYEFKIDTAGQGRDAYTIELSVDGERKETIALGGPGGGPGRGRGAAPPAAPAKPGPAPAKPAAQAATGVEPAVPPNPFPSRRWSWSRRIRWAWRCAPSDLSRESRRRIAPDRCDVCGEDGSVGRSHRQAAYPQPWWPTGDRAGHDQRSVAKLTGPGDTEARRRIFVCKPTSAAQETDCAKQIIANFTRKAFRRPVNAEDVADLDAVLRGGP